MHALWISLCKKAKFAKISCIDTARGDSPALPFGTPGPPPPRAQANSDERRPWSAGRRIGGCRFRFPFSVSSAKREELFFAGMRNLLDNNVCLSYIQAMKRISMFLSEPQLLALKKLSKRVGIKVSELIRRFIDEGLKRS
jgi:hypothetical protein